MFLVADLDPPLGTALGPIPWPGQFCISKEMCPVPAAWKSVELRGWLLQHSPDLRYAQLLDGRGDAVGWLIGLATLEGKLIADTYTVEDPADFDDLGGGWVAVHLGWQRIYCDSFGHLSVVYAEGGGGISTNPEFFRNKQKNTDLIQLMQLPEKNHWYPFGLTAWKNVRRLTPNHFLCMENWAEQRHWPDREMIENGLAEISLEEAAEIVSKAIKDNIRAVHTEFPLKISLTAGYDSRTVVACARQYADEMECVVHDLHPWTGQLDLAVAKRLSRKHHLKLAILPRRQSTPEQKALWLLRTGEAAAGASYAEVGTLSQDGDLVPTLTGHGAEVLKGYYQPDNAQDHMSLDELIRGTELPANDEVRKVAEVWLKGLEDIGASPKLIWDLLYPEHPGAGWGGAMRYGTPGAMGFWAFSHRSVLKAAICLPAKLKKQKAVHLRVIEREWPELLEVPVNKWWGWRGQLARGKRVIKKLGAKFR